MSFDDEDTSPERRLFVTFDGVKVELPCSGPGPDKVTVGNLYRRWCEEGESESFEIRDAADKLVAVGTRIQTVRRALVVGDD